MKEKILIGVFIFFIIVIILEVIFFFFLINKNIQNTIASLISSNSIINKKQDEICLRKRKNNAGAIDSQTIQNLINLNRGVVISSKVENTYQGKIIEINHMPGKFERENFSYILKIRIQGENKAINSFYFNEKELSKIILKKNKKIISINDLKVNDKIKITENLNLLASLTDNLINFTIEVL